MKTLKIGARLLLADELVERLRADRRLEGVDILSRTADEPVGHGLFVRLFGGVVKSAPQNVGERSSFWRVAQNAAHDQHRPHADRD